MQARQLVQEGGDAAFEMIAHEFGEAKVVASVLLYTFGELRREGLDVDGIPVDHLRELFSLLKAGRFAKEALPELVREMARTRSRASEAIAVLGVTQLSRRDLESIVDEVLRASQDLIASRGDAAEKALMGQVMKRVRGRADGKLVSQVLHERLETHLTEKPKGRKKKGKAPQQGQAPKTIHACLSSVSLPASFLPWGGLNPPRGQAPVD